MAAQKSSLGFQVPEARLTEGTLVAITSEAIATWRATLPLADIGISSKQLYQVIKESNLISITARERFLILDLLRPPLQYLVQGLRKHYINQSHNLTDKKIKISALVRALLLEMVTGYKLLIEHLHREGTKAELKELLAHALYQCLNYYNHLLLRQYQLYSAEEPGMWQEIHLLHQVALDYKIQDELLYKEARLVQAPSIEQLYLKILLLKATSPRNWRQSDIEAINNATTNWSTFIELKPFHERQINQAGVFIVLAKSDEPPLALEHLQPGLLTNEAQSFTCHNLGKHLSEITDNLDENEFAARLKHHESEYSVSLSVLKQLVKNFTQLQATKQVVGTATAVEFAYGLNAAHYYLNGEKKFQTPSDVSETEEAEQGSGLSLARDDAILSESVSENIDFSHLSLQAQISTPSVTVDYPLQKAELQNFDKLKASLKWAINGHPNLQPGELVVFRQNQGTPWYLGVIRELRFTDESEALVGLEYLSKKPSAAAIQLLKDDKGAGYHLRCLVLPPWDEPTDVLDKTRQYPSIITPTLPFKANHEASLSLSHQANKTRHLRLNLLSENTNVYKQFVVTEIVDEQAPKEQAQDTTVAPPVRPVVKKQDDGEFDSIWTSL